GCEQPSRGRRCQRRISRKRGGRERIGFGPAAYGEDLTLLSWQTYCSDLIDLCPNQFRSLLSPWHQVIRLKWAKIEVRPTTRASQDRGYRWTYAGLAPECRLSRCVRQVQRACNSVAQTIEKGRGRPQD